MSRKNIVLCSDGTGNTMTRNRGSNVWKLYEAIDLTSHRHELGASEQVAFYDDGVGTEDNKILKIAGGAFGFGLSRNVQDLYEALCRAYRPGDQIYLFGFSRGAFTVRTLVGLIVTCGVIKDAARMTDRDLKARVAEAYGRFRKHFSTKQREVFSRMRGKSVDDQAEQVTEEFRQKYADSGDPTADDGKVPIRFVGVWDTVSAVGLPFAELTDFWNAFIYPFKFPDFKLSPRVEQACQALSIDDARRTFSPMLWDEATGRQGADRAGMVRWRAFERRRRLP